MGILCKHIEVVYFIQENETNKEVKILLKTVQCSAIHKMFTMVNLHRERSLQDCEEPV